VADLRTRAAGDIGLSAYAPAFAVADITDDELVRFLADCATPYDVAEGLHALRVAAKARTTHMTMPLPMAPSFLEEWAQIVSFDGVTKDGETALFVCLSRRMQDALLSDPVPFLHALIGLMDQARRDVFVPGRMESVQTVVQVERGFRLSPRSISDFTSATQLVMGALTDMFPSITSRILVVNLPGYAAWFVKFIQGFLCEASANKIELIQHYEQLLQYYDEESLPSYYRKRRSVTP